MAPRYDRFITTHRPRWQELEALLLAVKKQGIQQTSMQDLQKLGELYRLTSSDLAIARRDFPRDPVAVYLNELVARGHGVVYRGQPGSAQDVGHFVRYAFPAAFRRIGAYTLVCFGIAMLAATVSAILVTIRSSFADVLLSGEAQTLRDVMAHHHLWLQKATERHSVAAGEIMTNNIQVAIIAFAAGMLVAAPTIYVMITNGINLGAVAALVAQYHLNIQFWSFVAPHGVIELSVIFAAGGAGMSIGDALLRPGLRRRADAVMEAARTAAQVLLGCAALLVVAGTIEAFFSPSPAPSALKFAVAGFLLVLLYMWVLGSREHVTVRRYAFGELLRPACPADSTAQS